MEETEIPKTSEDLNEKVLDEMKQHLINSLFWTPGGITPEQKGGQSCGVINSEMTLYSEELEVKITIGYNKSRIKNQELALTLFKLAMDDLIR